MSNYDRKSQYERWLSQLKNGGVVDLLRHDGFPAWVDLVSTSLLQEELSELSDANEDDLREKFRKTQVQSLARRLILSRNCSLFDSLQPLWRAFGSSEAQCVAVLESIGAVQGDWPTGVCHLSLSGGHMGFNAAHADFVEALRKVGQEDASGVLGTAIRTSRISDERQHVGFPLVLCGNNDSSLRNAVWVSPTTTPLESQSQSLKTSWEHVCSCVDQVIQGHQSSAKLVWSLPDWVHRLAETEAGNVATLDSAGLGLAMQCLARQAGHNLPFGVGFTGRWENGQLHGVRDLVAKAEAAREAGVFLLFACCDPEEPEPDPVEGVRIALLQEGLALDDVVRLVNRACADSGLTEYRWRESVNRFRATDLSSTAFTPDLPEALNQSLCPVGFVGRERLLRDLQQNVARSSNARHLVAVVGPARCGKTTLLSRFASEHTPYPVWFSFRRGVASRQTLAQLQETVLDQITARYGAVPSTTQSTDTQDVQEQITSAIEAIDGPINCLVDGIDEAQSPSAVLGWLQQMPGTGHVIVGSQPVDIVDNIDCTKITVQTNTESGQADAEALISRFAERFSAVERLRLIANHLWDKTWIEGLANKSGNNLWILTEFLSAIERDEAGWPDSPDNLLISSNLREYSKQLVAAALADYDEKERTLVETFLAFRAYLDNRPWPVQDVLRLAGNAIADAPIGTWSATGLLRQSVRRVVEFDGLRCRFWNPLTHEAVRRNYAGELERICKRFIQFIENGYEEHSDEWSEQELAEHIIDSLPSMIATDGNDESVTSSECTNQLFSSPTWFHLSVLRVTDDKSKATDLYARLEILGQYHTIPRLLMRAMRQHMNFLAEHADSTFGVLYHQCAYTTDACLRKFSEGWLRLWKKSGRPWLRALHSPAEPLEGPLICRLTGHTGAVLDVAVTSDGQKAATVSADGTIRIWNLPSGECLSVLRPDSIKPTFFEMTNASTGEEIPIEQSGPPDITAVAFSPDGKLLASGHRDTTVRLWQVSDGRELARLERHKDTVKSVAFSPDGSLLASSAWDSTVRVWDVANRSEVATLSSDIRHIEAVVFTPDGKRLVACSAGWERGKVFLWETHNWDAQPKVLECSSAIKSISISPDGRFLAAATDENVIVVFDLTQDARPALLSDDAHVYLETLTFLPCGTRLAAGGNDRFLKVWNIQERRIEASLEGHQDNITSTAISPDGRFAITGSYEKTAIVWDLSRQDKSPHPAHDDHKLVSIPSHEYVKNGEFLATSGYCAVRLWNPEDGRQIANLSDNASAEWVPICIAVWEGDTEGEPPLIVAGGSDGLVRVWECSCESDQAIQPIWREQCGECDVECIAITEDGTRIVAGDRDGIVRVAQRDRSGWTTTYQRHLNWILGVSFSSDGKMVASCSKDRTVRVWDSATEDTLAMLSVGLSYGPSSELGTRARRPDDKRWDHVDDGDVRGPWFLTVAISPDCRWVAAGTDDDAYFGNSVYVWDLRAIASGNVVRPVRLQGHEGTVDRLMFSSDSTMLASGSADNTVRVWDVEQAKFIRIIGARVPDKTMFDSVEPNRWQRYVEGSATRLSNGETDLWLPGTPRLVRNPQNPLLWAGPQSPGTRILFYKIEQ